MVETKMDRDDSSENKAKYRYALQHFEELNRRMEELGEPERYIFHFLSPNGYAAFFDHLRSGSLLEGRFRCELENLLEVSDETD
ncbi:hypothetical protein [Dysosmobacter acutus]|uniref:hypothetical protein n=1 Tax=Dysosmobacter acutus TaxID=2841504 RepID=UPI0030B9E6A0